MKKYFIEKPEWIRAKFTMGENYRKIKETIDNYKLNTICQSGSCPNMGECWNKGVATFMILGNICTRSCSFCGVKTGRPNTVNWEEPERVAYSIKNMKIKHAVITSVDRDDLKDMGSLIWTETVQAIRRISPVTTIETLIPDFQGNKSILDRIIYVKPEVISHNLETVRRLTKKVRIQAKYDRSLNVLRYLKENGKISTKTSIMLGLGENKEEVLQAMLDIKKAQVDIITIGQYLKPKNGRISVHDFIHPDQFKKYKEIGIDMGFRHVESGALIRSSYNADKHIN